MRKKTGSYNETTIENRISLQKMIRIQMKEQLNLKNKQTFILIRWSIYKFIKRSYGCY